VPTMEICPNCKSEMTITEITPIFLADGFEECHLQMQRVSFGHEAHVQTTFGRVGTCHTPKFPRILPMTQKRELQQKPLGFPHADRRTAPVQ